MTAGGMPKANFSGPVFGRVCGLAVSCLLALPALMIAISASSAEDADLPAFGVANQSISRFSRAAELLNRQIAEATPSATSGAVSVPAVPAHAPAAGDATHAEPSPHATEPAPHAVPEAVRPDAPPVAAASPVEKPAVAAKDVPVAKPAAMAPARPKKPAAKNNTPPADIARGSKGLAEQYCLNAADAAADARFAWQTKTIADFEKELDQKIKVLEGKIDEYKDWLKRRDEFSAKANDTLVSIFTKMKPEAVAAQFATFDEETASAVLARLEPRVSSSILNEMDPARASRLTSIIAASAKKTTSAVAPPPGGKS